MSQYQSIRVEIENNIAILSLNRPEKLNALNIKCLQEMSEALRDIEHDDNIRCLVITGSGDKAFAAGADISELYNLTVPKAEEYAELGQRVFGRIEDFKKPVIAAINGFALGGGAELAWACHMRLASDNAVFGQPEIDLGLIPGFGGTQRLVKLVPKIIATEFLLTGEKFSAAKAYEFGLINHVTTQNELLPAAKKLAATIASKPGRAVNLLMRAIRESANMKMPDGLRLEADLFSQCVNTYDYKEGTSAFLEKRPPRFIHK
jgi:enoyl-CoA hydratase